MLVCFGILLLQCESYASAARTIVMYETKDLGFYLGYRGLHIGLGTQGLGFRIKKITQCSGLRVTATLNSSEPLP